jgi:uncharacterized membrane protein YjdF
VAADPSVSAVTPPGQAIALLARRCPRQFGALVAVCVTFGAVAAAREDRRAFAFFIVVAVCLAGVAFADLRARLSEPLLWGLVVFAGAHLAGGLLPSPQGPPTLYETWLLPGVLKYDQLVHLGASALATVLAWQVLGRYLDLGRTSPLLHAQLAAGVALGKGALNEVFEFLAAASGQQVLIGDGTNTGWDLVFDLAGVVIAGIWLVTSGSPRSTEDRTTRPPTASHVRAVL